MFSFLAKGVIGDILAPVASPGQQLHGAIDDNLIEKAQRLIREEGVDYMFRDPARDNAVPLHTAAKAGNQVMVDFLLELGGSLAVQDGSGNTPLHYAAKAGKVELVKYMVSQRGADVAARNRHRHTPYDVATNHIIRQYLLPLQLRAEPQPEPEGLSAVHNPDIVRDYSNLPPPPTSFPAQAYAPPTNYALPKQGGWIDPSVTRPIACDGFQSSAGDPRLAAKYGHTKMEVNVAPPPAIRPEGQVAGPPQPVPQFSAFAHGRPMARYVAYNALEKQQPQSAPWQPAPSTVPAPVPVNTAPPYAYSPPPPGVMHQQPPIGAVPTPMPPHVQRPALSPSQPQFAVPPPPAPQAPPPPPFHQQQYQQQSDSPTQQVNMAYMQQPQPRPPQLPAQAFQPVTFQPPTAPSSGGPSSVPRLPSPNRISVFQPAWSDNGDDAVPLT